MVPSTTDPGLSPEAPNASDTDNDPRYECDICGQSFSGQPPSSGMLMWTRGDEVRTEEPPLCEDCAQRLSLGALLSLSYEEE
jgi:hypothetical protein